MVETYVETELIQAEKFTNRTPLDDSGVFNLHTLAARIYAAGFNDGAATEDWRASSRRMRSRDRKEPTDV